MSHDHARRRYLTAKRSVDERARDRRVRDRLLAELPDRPRVVEAGPGAGLIVPTLLEWSVTPRSYLGVDEDDDAVRFARRLVPRVLRRRGHDAVGTAAGCRVGGTPVRFETGDALAVLPDTEADAGADLLVAQSFLDCVALGDALDAIDRALAPGGLAYAPCTFDGVTLFRPPHAADERVVDAYHRAIDATAGRDSRAGRNLLDRLRRRDARVLAAAASDWIVRPADGSYRDDERYFLERILAFVADALADVPGGDDWLAARFEQIDAGELVFVAHGYDVLWRPDG